MPLAAQDAERGARLYLGLPGGEASCVECHGPDPGADRNRLLNAARGPAAIDEALRKAAAMGYLAELLQPADRADLSAFLALVAAEAEGSSAATVWPWGVEFGRIAPGAAPPSQTVRVRNRGGFALPLSPRLRSPGAPGIEPPAGLWLSHDCPPLLPAGGECAVTLGLVAGPAGRLQAVLAWGDEAGALRPVGVAATVSDGPLGLARWQDDGSPASTTWQALPGGEVPAVLTLHNAGAAALVLGVPAITGPGRTAFRLDGGTCAAAAPLPPGGSCTVRVRATAPMAGVNEALLQWRTDGGHAPPRRLQVQAVGASPPPAPPAPPPAGAGVPETAPPGSPVAGPDTAAGAGCARAALAAGPADPLLPGLVVAALALAWWRRGGAGQVASVGGGGSPAPRSSPAPAA